MERLRQKKNVMMKGNSEYDRRISRDFGRDGETDIEEETATEEERE